MKNYETEARERWGATDAYREHEQKTQNYTKEKWTEITEEKSLKNDSKAYLRNTLRGK